MKKQITFTHAHLILKSSVLLLGSFVMVMFLFINISAVQQITPLYQNIANGQVGAVIKFLGKAKTLSDFQPLFPEVNQTFSLYKESVYAEDRRRQEEIVHLKSILEKNGNARDVLYALAVLYEKEGQKELSSYYFSKAKQIDPTVGTQLSNN